MKVASKIALVVFLLGSLPAWAGFRLPGYVYRMNQLNQAKQKAASERQPITFVLTDVDTNCGLCAAATKDVLRELSDHTVIVYIGPHDMEDIPPIVITAFRSSKSGRYIPKTVIVDAAFSKVIDIVPYMRNRGQRNELLAKARKKIFESKNPGDMKPTAPAVSLKLVVKFGWDGKLAPMPLVKLTEFFDTHSYKFKMIKSGANLCHFKVTLEGQKREDFQNRIQNFLEAYYLVEKEVQMKSKTTYWLKSR